MPYIKQKDRPKFDSALKDFPVPDTEGELNYILTKLCHQYIQKKGKTYSTYNQVVGVLDCAKLEIYRRHVGIYEDQKIIENGDV